MVSLVVIIDVEQSLLVNMLVKDTAASKAVVATNKVASEKEKGGRRVYRRRYPTS